MHDAGLASPDLFTRHVFVDESGRWPAFCFIDMARLDRRRVLSARLRARDLAALNVTAPMRHVSAKERLRFLHVYCGGRNRTLFRSIRKRVAHLLKRRKFASFARRGEVESSVGANAAPTGAQVFLRPPADGKAC
jgi:hypothetical protein